jgi:ribosomal protein S18 acetylase RimI-like enzyme
MTPGVRIRTAGEDDQRAIMTVRTASWRAAYAGIVEPAALDELDREDLADRIRRYREALAAGMHVTVAESTPHGIVGFCAFGPARVDRAMPSGPSETGAGEVYAVYVHPDHWRNGAGAALLTDAVDTLRSAGRSSVVLWTFEENGPARRFYERQGFHADGNRRPFRMDGGPGGPDDPVEMRYVLGGSRS